jgi:aspartyl-tRNA synthetase
MFEWDEGEKQWMAAHHPFTSPHDEDMGLLEAGVESVNDPQSPLSAVRALAYDVVLNGTELGSGSIRIHRQDIQSKIFRALGMSEEPSLVSDSSWKRWSTAHLRTEALRWASTASS